MNISEMQAQIGTQVGTSRWFTIDQSRIDAFADVTEDWQFIHLDAERAAQTPSKTTVAHGFLSLSMLSAMSYDGLPPIDGMKTSVNYGFDKLRFVAPVASGSKLRALFTLSHMTDKGQGRWQVGYSVVVEIDGADKPALTADWLVMYWL